MESDCPSHQLSQEQPLCFPSREHARSATLVGLNQGASLEAGEIDTKGLLRLERRDQTVEDDRLDVAED